jgi:hypothetical protein
MVKFILRSVVLACLVGALQVTAAEFEVQVDTEAKPWTHLDANDDPARFQFAVVTDRTGGHRPGVFEEGVERLNLLQPEFVMSVGDLIEGYTEDLDELDRQWAEFDGFVDSLDMPFFYVPGNHDISNPLMTEVWKKRLGRDYYHFVYRNVLFLCLNSEDPPPSNISDSQAEYVKLALEQNPEVRWTLVFLHKPLWNVPGDHGWNKVEDLLRPRKHTVFAGHTHNYFKNVRDHGNQYITLATMGGGSGLRGPNFGEFDHFLWVTMTDEGPIMANLMLSGIWDTNVITRERKEYLLPLLEGAAVRSQGVVVPAGTFESAETVLRLVNDADLPMNIEVRLLQDDLLRSSRRNVITVVAPNSVEEVPLTLTATNAVPVEALRPMRAEWTVTYELPDNVAPVEVRGQHRLVVDQVVPLPAATGAIEVDGDLGEWGALEVRPAEPGQVQTNQDAWYGNQDASAVFSLRTGQGFLYAGIAVTDDERRNADDEDYQRQDSIEFWLDARPEPDRTGGGNSLLVALPAGGDKSKAHRADNLPEGTQVASTRKRFGYEVEIAVPLSYIESLGGSTWTSVRANVAVIDHDGDGRAKVWYRPDWRSPADYAASGTFVRE